MKNIMIEQEDFVMVGPIQIDKLDTNWKEQAQVWLKIIDKKDMSKMPSRGAKVEGFNSCSLN